MLRYFVHHLPDRDAVFTEIFRRAIVARAEQFQNLPGLHAEELHAIEDALSSLRFLAREEARFDAETERRAINETLERFRSVGPAIKRVSGDAEPE